MLTQRYLSSAKNLKAILSKIVDGAPPERFNLEHLNGLGFTSSNDRAVIPLLKDLGFLDAEGRPTQRYLDYRDRSRSKSILGEALREAYSDLFLINEKLSKGDRDAIQGRFKSTYGVSDRVAEAQAATFLALLENASIDEISAVPRSEQLASQLHVDTSSSSSRDKPARRDISLSYRVEIHLPATRDIETYNVIFKALKEHLLSE
jgi:hypothetical protein